MNKTCTNCNAPLVSEQASASFLLRCPKCRLPLSLIAGKYQLLRRVGEGAVGAVFLARHHRLKKNAERVIKIIKPEMLSQDGMLERFEREIQITMELSQKNENIVRIYDDFGQEKEIGYYYVMEYIDGMTLRHYLNQEKVPSLAWTLEAFSQFCSALKTAHEANVIHRDLKPSNIMISKSESHPLLLKVLDWGIAKPIHDSLDFEETYAQLTKGAIGTPLYMAPEQILSRPVDERTDIYAMGTILYELLSGHNPFALLTGNKDHTQQYFLQIMEAQLYREPHPLKTLDMPYPISNKLEATVMKALAKKPEERFENVSVFWRALREAAGSKTTSTLSFSGSTTIREGTKAPALPSVPTGEELKIEETVLIVKRPSQNLLLLPLILVLFVLVLFVLGLLWNKRKNSKLLTPQVLRSLRLKNRGGTVETPRALQGSSQALEKREDGSVEAFASEKERLPEPYKEKVRKRKKVRKREPAKVLKRKIARKPKGCFRPGWRYLYIRPYLSKRAELTVEGGKSKKQTSRLLCLSPKVRRISIIQSGFSLCIFKISRRKKRIRIRLRSEGPFRSENYCIK